MSRPQTSIPDPDVVSPRPWGSKRKQSQVAAWEWKAQVVPSKLGCRVIIVKSGPAAKKVKTKGGAVWPVGEGAGVMQGMHNVLLAAAERVEGLGEEPGHMAGNVLPGKSVAAGPDGEDGAQPDIRVAPVAAAGRVTRSHARVVLPPVGPVRDNAKRRRVNRDLVAGCVAVQIKWWDGVTDGEKFVGGREFRRRRRSGRDCRGGAGGAGRVEKAGLVEEVLGRDGRIEWFPVTVKVPGAPKKRKQGGGQPAVSGSMEAVACAEVVRIEEDEAGAEGEAEAEAEAEAYAMRDGDVVGNLERRMTRRQADEELAITLMEQVKELEARRNRVRSLLGGRV